MVRETNHPCPSDQPWYTVDRECAFGAQPLTHFFAFPKIQNKKKNNKTKKYKNRDFIRMGLNGHNVWIL